MEQELLSIGFTLKDGVYHYKMSGFQFPTYFLLYKDTEGFYTVDVEAKKQYMNIEEIKSAII
jgi:hypothetical protein